MQIHLMFLVLFCIPLVLAKKWSSTNPGGGGSFSSPIILSNGNWAVASDLGGMFITKNKAKSWKPVGAKQGLTVTHISSLAEQPANGVKIIIGTDDGIFLSDSAGKKVKKVHRGGYISAITVAPSNPRIVYASTANGRLLKSTNGGNSFSAVKTEKGIGNDNVRVLGLRVNPRDLNTIWILSGWSRFAENAIKRAYVSFDGGLRFSMSQPSNVDVVDITYAYDNKNPNKMFMTTEDGEGGEGGRFWISLNNGKAWNRIKPSNRDVTSVAGQIIPNLKNPNFVRVIQTYDSEMWSSSDAGKSWKVNSLRVSGGWSRSDEDWGMGGSHQGDPQTIGYALHSPEILLWVNVQFVYKSLNGGVSWTDAVSKRKGNSWRSRGIDNVVPNVIEPSDVDQKLLYAGYADMGIWRSDDGGKYWKDLNPGSKYSHSWDGKGGNTFTVAADPTIKNKVWAQVSGDIGGPTHLLKSLNRGETWIELTKGLPKKRTYIESLEVLPDSSPSNRWMHVIVDGDVYLSRDDGNSWELSLKCGDCTGVRYTEDNGIISFGPSGLFRNWKRSRDSWEKITDSLPRSTTDGWEKGTHWLDDQWTFEGPLDLAAKGKYLWLAVRGKGLYFSDDYAQSWTLVYSNQYTRSVAVHHSGTVMVASSSSVYAGGFEPESTGIAVHKNGREKTGWTPMSKGLVFPFATKVVASKNGQWWCLSPGQGIMKLK